MKMFRAPKIRRLEEQNREGHPIYFLSLPCSLYPSCSARSQRKVFSSESSIVVYGVKVVQSTSYYVWKIKHGKINISKTIISRSMESLKYKHNHNLVKVTTND